MKYPRLVHDARTPVRVVILTEEPNEFGERPVILDKSLLCNYQDSSTVKYTSDKQSTIITGKLFIDGDIMQSESVVNTSFNIAEDGVLYSDLGVTKKGILFSDFNVTEDGVLSLTRNVVEPIHDDIVSGYVIIFGKRREIANGCRARNPDGSVNYTKIEVI